MNRQFFKTQEAVFELESAKIVLLGNFNPYPFGYRRTFVVTLVGLLVMACSFVAVERNGSLQLNDLSSHL